VTWFWGESPRPTAKQEHPLTVVAAEGQLNIISYFGVPAVSRKNDKFKKKTGKFRIPAVAYEKGRPAQVCKTAIRFVCAIGTFAIAWRYYQSMHCSTPSSRKLLLLLVGWLFCGSLIVGCGRATSAKYNTVVSGKVTVDGNPAKGIVVTLYFGDAKPVPIGVKDDGSFYHKGAPVGKATVVFTSTTIPADVSSKLEKVKEKIKGTEGKSEEMQKYFGTSGGAKIPAKYTSRTTSDQTWEITEGTNEKTFNLKE
jgi:hypothetical protein